VAVLKLPKGKDAILSNDDLGELSKHIGFFVIVWSLVEESVRDLYVALAIQSDDRSVTRAIVSNVTFRQQVDTIRRIAVLHRPGTEWEANLAKCLKDVDGPLAIKRNRFIHDPWIENDDGVIEQHFRGRDETVLSAKDGKRGLKLVEPKARSLDDLRAVLDEAYAAHVELVNLRAEYFMWRVENPPTDIWEEVRPGYWSAQASEDEGA
jgi:hypothetical protein